MTQPHGPAPPAGSTPLLITEQLKAERIQPMLRDLPAWELQADGKAIQRSWTVPSLWTGTAFAGAIAAILEHHEHAATITVMPGWVGVALSTPGADGLTQRDFQVAEALELGA